jgi:glyoxylase I family protein
VGLNLRRLDHGYVPEDAIDHAAIFARGGANHGDEDFALFKCPDCGQVYLLEYEVDTVYLDATDLSKRVPVSSSSFRCVACRRDVARGAWAGPRVEERFRVTWAELDASGWRWAAAKRGQGGARRPTDARETEVFMSREERGPSPAGAATSGARPHGVVGVHGVRYQVKDVARAVAFYTERFGFKLEHQQPPAFASVSLGAFTLLLSGPGASGSRPVRGQPQEPGGWNRVVLRVADLPAQIEALKKAGVTCRNEMEVGPGGRQVQVDDPDGNPIELFEPAR